MNWEKSFIAKETYDILRISVRGYFAYVRYHIEIASNTPRHLLPSDVNPQFAITPAHSTTSFIKAWFSLARIMGFDEAMKYVSGVANRLMSQGIKSALKDNPMYDKEDIGDIAENKKDIGPLELAKMHKSKRKVRDALIDMYLDKKQPYSSPASAFGSIIEGMEEMPTDSVSIVLLFIEHSMVTCQVGMSHIRFCSIYHR